MDLRRYLRSHNIAVNAFAATVGVNPTTLHRYMNRDRVPRPQVLERIARLTKRAVLPNDFFSFARPAGAPPPLASRRHKPPPAAHAT